MYKVGRHDFEFICFDELAITFSSKSLVNRFHLLLLMDFNKPGRPHCRHRSRFGCNFEACFKWHLVAVATLAGLFSTSELQLSALGTTLTHSAHFAGIGSDKLAIDAFIKPALAAYGVHCRLDAVLSVEIWL